MGRATFAAGLDPEQALLIHREMERARMGFIMQGDLHISFLVVPMDEDVLVSSKKGDSSAYRAMEDIFTGMQVQLYPKLHPMKARRALLAPLIHNVRFP